MNQNNHPAIKHKLGLLELADQLKNASRACKVMGVSRDTFYRIQNAYEDGSESVRSDLGYYRAGSADMICSTGLTS